jgi:acyl-CoA thioesterase-1
VLVLIAFSFGCCSLDPVPVPVNGERPIKIVVLGDSLSAGFGLLWGYGFTEKLERALKDKGIAVTVVNAGVSGDTVSDGLQRLDKSVPEGSDAVIIELGANDAERGINPSLTQAALGSILQRLQDRHIPVLLAGFRAPPDKGPAYGRAFAAIYPSLASTYSYVWYPDIIDGVAGNSSLIQIDGEHPNAAGVNVIVERILPQVEELITRTRTVRAQ